MPADRLNVPESFFRSLAAFEDNHVLRPADFHGMFQPFRAVHIRPPELPHPAEIPGGEAHGVRVCLSEMLGGSDSGTFFRPGADESADFTVQLHLRQ